MSSDIDVLKLEMRPFVKRSVTTGPGNVAGTTLVDASLTEPDDYWNGMCILIRTAGAIVDCSGQLRRVLDWDLATNTLTVNVPFTDPAHPADPKIEAGVQYVMQCPGSDPEVVAIEAKLDDPDHGLVKIKDEVANIETAVAPANGTTSANGNPGGTTVVDTTRTEPNDHWNNMALLITSGAQNGQVREITDWVVGTGTFTVAPAFGGQILADVTYKILSHLPADIDIAAIEAKLDDPGHGLEAIDTEVEAVEGKLDARLDATISSRAPEAGGNITAIKAETDKLPGSDVDTESAALNIGAGEVTLFTIATATRLEVLGAFCSMAGTTPVTGGASITVRVYLTINGTEVKIAENKYVKGTDPDGIIILDSTIGITGNLKVTLQSDNAGDNATTVPYQYVTRTME